MPVKQELHVPGKVEQFPDQIISRRQLAAEGRRLAVMDALHRATSVLAGRAKHAMVLVLISVDFKLRHNRNNVIAGPKQSYLYDCLNKANAPTPPLSILLQ